jgi:phosphatidylinositol alpha-1,6-mannosyltransferase
MLASYDFPPMGGGIARMMGELARRYPPGTLLVTTGSQAGSEAVDADLPNRVDRVRIQSSRLRTIQGLFVWSGRARTLARSFRPRFLWCGNFKPAGYPALWVRRREGVPYGIFLHGSELLLLRERMTASRRKSIAAKAILRHASVLVTVSSWTRRLCLEVLGELGWDAEDFDVRTVPLGTDPRRFQPGMDTRDVRARYGLGEGRWLLTVARLAVHKGVDTGLQVLADLKRDYPDLRYAVVGSGIKLGQLQALAQELGVTDQVRFLTDVPDADLPALYNCAEIYLGLSRPAELLIEGFGIVFSEAAACGVPAIGGQAGGIPDAVKDGETGILVDSTDPGTVGDVVRCLLEDPALGRRMGQAGRRAVERYFNWDRVTADVRAIGEEFS